MRSLIHRLRTRLGSGCQEATDESLLTEFVAHRTDDAFTAIVNRHGPMVLGVCRRMLRNDADADDAFQAVFLVLVRKAELVRPRSRLGNFLYGVAVNVARRGHTTRARRAMQAIAADVPERTPTNGDLREVLDLELSGLPDVYRAVVVACDLEGYTRAEAAGRLGCSEGTVASRLARGRAILADRLARRGVALPATGLTAALGTHARAAVPVRACSPWLRHPSPAAEGLAGEVMRTMFTNKFRSAAVLLLATVGIAGAGAATVWACGGYGPRLAPPVGSNKPFPPESNATRTARASDATAIWARPTAGAPADAGVDKPARANTVAGAAKPARFVLKNPARDITVVSDRHEEFTEFFRRQPVMVATVQPELLKRLRNGTAGDTFDFVNGASHNVDGPRNAAYGASVKLAPAPNDARLLDLLMSATGDEPLIFVCDAADKHLWHFAGVTRRSSIGFFASTARVPPDEFAPADLLQTTEKKK
ncbi:MAG TPA: sigma-70 family RNA polymerase sigma factor [Gemmata sp.]